MKVAGTGGAGATPMVAPLDVFASSAATQYHFAALLGTLLAGTPQALLDAMPHEERLVLLTVRDLAGWHARQRREQHGAETP